MTEEQQKTFDDFWKNRWPKCRRIDKKKAADQWAKLRGQGSVFKGLQSFYASIFTALDRQKKQPSWNTGDCKFIPYPHLWLRDRRWEDEITLPEDKDAELLLDALERSSMLPTDLPSHIAERGMRMLRRLNVNWARLHHRLTIDPDAAEQIKADYIATS